MGRHSGPPRYCRHTTSGRAFVTFPQPFQGKRTHYLGEHGTRQTSPESWERYDRLIAEWTLGKEESVADAAESSLTIASLCRLYLERCEGRYRKRGRATGQLGRVRAAIKPLKSLYGSSPVADFGPKALLVVREWMVRDAHCRECRGELCPRCGGSGKRGWSRGFINACVGIIKTMMDWAGSKELVSGSVCHSLRTVKSLGRGEDGVREAPPILAVKQAHVKATLAELSPTVSDMVSLQLLAGMRPCEICGIRPRDLNFAGDVDQIGRFRGVWIYEVTDDYNKNARKGQRRIVAIGPRAMKILKPYLRTKGPDDFLFSPREASEWYYRRKGQRINHARARCPGNVYSTRAYERAIEKAAKRAGVPHWCPNQLRHARATEIRSKFTPDHARVVLGHALPGVTGVYAETDYGKAAEVMRKIG